MKWQPGQFLDTKPQEASRSERIEMQANSVARNSSQATTSKTVPDTNNKQLHEDSIDISRASDNYDMFDEDQGLADEALIALKANCSKKGITREYLERLVHN